MTSLVIIRRSYKKEIKMQSLLPLIFMSAVHVKAEGIWFLDALKSDSQQDRYQRSIISQVIESLGTSLGINTLGNIEDKQVVSERRRDHVGRQHQTAVCASRVFTFQVQNRNGPCCMWPTRSVFKDRERQ